MTSLQRAIPLALLGIVTGSLVGCGPAKPPVADTPPPVVTVSQPIEREVVDYDHYTGYTEAMSTVEIRARVRGELIKVYFEDGAIIKAGDPLFDIDDRQYKAALAAAEAKKASAEANFKQADAEFNRTRALVARGGAAQADLELWAARKGMATADIGLAEADITKARLDVEFTRIKAPIAGRISRPLVTPGNLVNAAGGDTLLTTIVSIDPMYVYFDADEPALLRFQQKGREKTGTKEPTDSVKQAKVPVTMGLVTDKDDYPFAGSIDFAENKVDRATGTIRVRAVFPNADRRLTPGLFAKVRIPVSDMYKAILVNDRAVGTDQGQKYLLVINEQNKAEYRTVTPGRLEGDLRVFQPGPTLKAGEWVVVNGMQRVRPGIEVKPERVPMPTRSQAKQGPAAPEANGKPNGGAPRTPPTK